MLKVSTLTKMIFNFHLIVQLEQSTPSSLRLRTQIKLKNKEVIWILCLFFVLPVNLVINQFIFQVNPLS